MVLRPRAVRRVGRLAGPESLGAVGQTSVDVQAYEHQRMIWMGLIFHRILDTVSIKIGKIVGIMRVSKFLDRSYIRHLFVTTSI